MDIAEFLENDIKKLELIIEKRPKQISAPIVAEYLGCSSEGLRCSITQFGKIGLHWTVLGKLTSGNCISTAKFIRWVLNKE